MKQACPVCTLAAVSTRGPVNSKILVVLSHPDWADVMYGYPFAVDTSRKHKMTSGHIMQSECMRAGLDLNAMRVSCLWPHQELHDDRCLEVGRDITIEEAKSRSAILLVGAQAVKFFTGYNVSDVSGLPITNCTLSAPIVYPLVNPSQLLVKGAGVGELRFGLNEFATRLREEHLL